MQNLADISMATPIDGSHELTFTQAIQIAPNRRHASSNYHYHSEILNPYGVSEVAWNTFTLQFVNANLPTRNELLGLAAASVILQCVFTFMLGPPGLPVGAIISGGITTGPVFFALKGHRLRHHVRNHDVSRWLAAWNTEYFNPKGLMVGFNLPGRRVQHAAIAPQARKNSLSTARYKKAKSQRSVVNRPRIVIVKIHDPLPQSGRVPQIDPIRVSRIYKSIYTCVTIYSLSKVLIHQDLRSTKTLLSSPKVRAKFDAKRLALERVRKERAVLIADRAARQRSLEHPIGPTTEHLSTVQSPKTSPVFSLWRERHHRKENEVLSTGRLPKDPKSVHGKSHSGIQKLQSRFKRRRRDETAMLGSSRMTDASQNVL